MKLQTLTVLFIIIILPITMVVSQYIKTEISTITLQSEYDTKLNNATYDAIKAFQMNESNSTTENIPTEKIRDVNASVNSFYNSMAASMGVSGYTEEDLKGYIPCLVYTLYDGYYIYTAYNNNGTKEYGLKPYVYYTEKVDGINSSGEKVDVTVSYTLDSYIMVAGTIAGNMYTKSGYLCANDISFDNNFEFLEETVEYNGTPIKLHYKYLKDENNYLNKYYPIYNIFQYEWYEYSTTGKLQKVTNKSTIKKLNEGQINSTNPSNQTPDYSANNYITESQTFTREISKKLGSINTYEFLNITLDNDPDKYSSAFNEHRRQVIKNSITTNLQATLTNYKGNISEFQMPELDETEWDKIINNVSLISFMQGLPLQNKYYRGYSVVTNTQSREFVNPSEIYLKDTNSKKYHKITCKSGYNSTVGYRNTSFRRKKFTNTNETPPTENYYFNQPLKDENNYSTCYECIVTSSNTYNSLEEALSKANNNNKQAYYKALYRERYVNYKSLNFGTQ